MTYESVPLSRYKARYNSDNDDNALIFQLVRDGAKVTPSSATIAVYSPSSSTAILAATAMAASGSLLSYSMDTTDTDTWPVGTGYRARIVVTSGGVTYDEDIYFDVTKAVPQGRITRDQLVKLDERVNAMQWAGDDDFSELIEGCWEDCQFDIETRQVDGTRMLDSMVVDRARLSIALRELAVARLLRPKGHVEDSEYHEAQYHARMLQVLSGGVRLDTTGELKEDDEQYNAQAIRVGH